MLGLLKKLFAPGDNTKLKEALAAGAVLIDVRSPGEFASGHVKGAVNIPVDRLGNQVQVLKKDKPVVVYCRSGARSMAAKALLEKKGFKNIVDGGSISTVEKLLNTK